MRDPEPLELLKLERIVIIVIKLVLTNQMQRVIKKVMNM